MDSSVPAEPVGLGWQVSQRQSRVRKNFECWSIFPAHVGFFPKILVSGWTQLTTIDNSCWQLFIQFTIHPGLVTELEPNHLSRRSVLEITPW